MILSKDKNNLLYTMLIAFAFFAFLTPLSDVFFVILCALMIFSIFVLNDSDTLCFITFTSCFMGCFNIQTMFLKMFELLIVILMIRQLIVAIKSKNKKNIIFISAIFAFCLVLFIYGLVLTHLKVYKLWQSLGIILMLAIVYLLNEVSVKKATLILSLGLIVSTVLSLVSYYCGISGAQPFITDTISKFRFSAYFDYVNALALYCSLCQTCLLTLFLTNKLDIRKWFYLPILITIIGLFTFSKSFISITAVTYAIAILLGFIKSKNKHQFIKYGLVGVAIVTVIALIFHNYLEIVIKRFFLLNEYEGTLNIVTTGRFDIWKTYFKHLASSPLYILFGCGITADSVGKYTPHNLFVSILYRFGIVGILVLIGFALFIIKQIGLKKNVSCYLPLFIVLINAFFEDVSSSLFTCLPLIIAILFVLKNKNTDIQK